MDFLNRQLFFSGLLSLKNVSLWHRIWYIIWLDCLKKNVENFVKNLY